MIGVEELSLSSKQCSLNTPGLKLDTGEVSLITHIHSTRIGEEEVFLGKSIVSPSCRTSSPTGTHQSVPRPTNTSSENLP